MKVNCSSDLTMDCPSPECQKNIQESSSRNPCKHHWTSATNDLEMDLCCSSIGPGHIKSLAKVTEDGIKCPYRSKHSPGYTWRTDDCVSLHTDSMVEDNNFNSVNNPQTGYNSDYCDSEQDEICISVHPKVSNGPGSREEASLRVYREYNEEVFDSVDQFASVQDSGAVFLNSNGGFTSDASHLGLRAEQHPVSSFYDSGISYKATTSTSSRGFPPAWHAANANATKHRSKGAVFAGGMLSSLFTIQQNLSQLSLGVSSLSAKPGVHQTFTTSTSAAEKKPDTVGSSEDHQLMAKRLKCSGKKYPFDFQELLQATNDISSYHQQLVQQSSNDSRTLSQKSESCDFYQSLGDQDEDGDTIVHIALILERMDVVINLMDYLTNANDLNIQNHLGQTVLHLAVLLDFDELARMFVLLGAQVAIQDRNGNTPLHLACAKGGDHKSIIALTQPPSPKDRLDSGHTTAVPFQRIPQDPDLRNFEGLTCLHVAAERGFLTALNYLIQYCGADPNAQEYRAGETVLHRAVRDNNLELVRYLLSFEEVNVNARRYDGCTPLQLVTEGEAGVDAGGGGGKGQQNSELIEHLLVEKGAAVIDIDTVAAGEVDFISDNFNAICMDTEFDYDDFVIGGSIIS